MGDTETCRSPQELLITTAIYQGYFVPDTQESPILPRLGAVAGPLSEEVEALDA